jgi:hypothetical protein
LEENFPKRSGGKPPFLTLETFNLESLSLKHECLTGLEEGLAPALANLY